MIDSFLKTFEMFHTAKEPEISAKGDPCRISQHEHIRSVRLLKPGQRHTKEGTGWYGSL